MIRIVTDSAVDLPRTTIDEYKIGVVPGRISFADKTYLAFYDLTPSRFYELLAESKDLPIQRDSDMRDFRDIYNKVLKDEPNASILSLHVSDALAGTISSARSAAAALPMADIRLLTTRSASVGQGLIVLEAARMAKEGASLQLIMNRVSDMGNKMQMYFVVDTLEYLAKGGRVGATRRFVGSLLNVKPILTLKEGMVQPYDQQRSRGRAIKALKDLVLSELKGKQGVRFGLAHAVCEQEARELFNELTRAIKPEHSLFTEVGPSVGTHVGPGTIAACWYVPD